MRIYLWVLRLLGFLLWNLAVGSEDDASCSVLGPNKRSTAPRLALVTPVHDLNVPYKGTEEYETPIADMLFTPVSCRTL